jgi:hypothetical protein
MNKSLRYINVSKLEISNLSRMGCKAVIFSLLRNLFNFYTPVFKMGRIMEYQCPSVRPFHMSRSNLRTPWPIHFKFHKVIGIDGLTVCILYGEISNFHSRVMGLYSSNCRRFKYCMNVDDGRIMHSWCSCLLNRLYNITWFGAVYA